jgi:asparagine synthase (glutamine-hydrolysing)
MCGFSAILGIDQGESRHARNILEMTRIIRHRGPDDEGYVLVDLEGRATAYLGDDSPYTQSSPESAISCQAQHINTADDRETLVALGHRRLSIVDTSAHGHQPMTSPDGSYWIVFNGEIYNYKEIAADLNALGVSVPNTSDTEVLLKAYEHWGEDCVHHFNGMFAFVIVDLKKRTVFAARDRFGIKPLYYYVHPQGMIALASEIKQFTVLPDWRAKINKQRAYDYLVWSATDHTNETLFQNVSQLLPGEAVSISFDEIASKGFPSAPKLPVYRWYTLEAEPFSGTFDDAAHRFRELLTRSVRLRMRSDVPVGSCLSGGLDSSSIVMLMNEILNNGAGGKVSTFSVCSKVQRFDERKWMDIVLDKVNATPHFTYPSLDRLFADLPDITWHQDEPFSSTSIYAQWNVFQLASETNVTVMLDGQGADEQLAGYDNFFGVRLAHLLTRFKWLSLARELASIKQLRGYSPLRMLMIMADNAFPVTITNQLRKLANKANAKPDWIDITRLGAQPIDPLGKYHARSTSIKAVNHAQITATHLQQLLHFEDRNSMAYSIEARVPFMDHHLVEFVLGLPDEFKLENGVTKRVLREGLKGVLPEPIRLRMDKIGFQTPEETWMRGDQKEIFLKEVENTIERSNGILTEAALERCKAIFDGKVGYSNLPWKIISFGAWLKAFDVELN